MIVLKTVALSKTYQAGNMSVKALKQVDLEIEHGEFISIVGTSGSGKSTLLNLLGGLDQPTSGEVYIDNVDLYKLNETERTIFRRRKIGFVFQGYNLIPTLNVYDNIILPLGLDGNKVDRDFIAGIIDTIGLSDKVATLPSHLSGGQQQRVALARALATKPAIILADEPTGNLDNKTSQDVLSTLKTSADKYSQTIIMVTHNQAIAQLADRMVHIEDGRVIRGHAL